MYPNESGAHLVVPLQAAHPDKQPARKSRLFALRASSSLCCRASVCARAQPVSHLFTDNETRATGALRDELKAVPVLLFLFPSLSLSISLSPPPPKQINNQLPMT